MELRSATVFQELVVLTILYVALHYFARLILPAKRAGHAMPLPPSPRGYPVFGALPLLGRAPHRALAALARLHGPIMHLTLGQRGIVVPSTSATARLLLKDHGASFLNRPAVEAAQTLLAYGAQDLVFAPYGPRWRRLRQECSIGLLGPQALADLADTRREEVGHMVQTVLAQRGKAVEVSEFLFCTMANTIGQVVVGRRVFNQTGGEATREFKEMVVELMTTVAWMDLRGLSRRMRRLWARLDRVWNRLLSDHEAAMVSCSGKS